MSDVAPPSPTDTPPPRAFTQGVGTVYQFSGVMLFLVMMSVCCGSGLMSMETAERDDLAAIGWRIAGPQSPMYSVQKAISVSLFVSIGLGIAVSAMGLGLQAQNRKTPPGAVIVSSVGVAFWLFHTAFFAIALGSIVLTLVCGLLLVFFVALLALAIASWREMRRDPPPADLTDLPPSYKMPYSHLHDEAPEVRFAAEMQERRRKLEIQTKELEALEERIKNNRYKRGES